MKKYLILIGLIAYTVGSIFATLDNMPASVFCGMVGGYSIGLILANWRYID